MRSALQVGHTWEAENDLGGEAVVIYRLFFLFARLVRSGFGRRVAGLCSSSQPPKIIKSYRSKLSADSLISL